MFADFELKRLFKGAFSAGFTPAFFAPELELVLGPLLEFVIGGDALPNGIKLLNENELFFLFTGEAEFTTPEAAFTTVFMAPEAAWAIAFTAPTIGLDPVADGAAFISN
jgi:hypothetical protein